MVKELLLFLLLLLLAGVLLTGCGGLNPFSGDEEPETAQELFSAGQSAMDQENYSQAEEYFQQVREDYPFSPYTSKAELNLADAYFRQEKYAAAETAYREFESMYPGNPAIARVLFRIGRANMAQFESIDQNTKELQQAIDVFSRLTQVHPDSEYADRAEELISECRRKLAEHEIYVADFYMRTERYQSAWLRYSFVEKNFPELREINNYASKRAKRAYFRYLLQSSEAVRMEQRGSWKLWFNWL